MITHKGWDIDEHETGRFKNGKPVIGATFQNGLNDIEPDGSFIPCDMDLEAISDGVTTHQVKRGRFGQLRFTDADSANKHLCKIKYKDGKGLSFKYLGGDSGLPDTANGKPCFVADNGVKIEHTPIYKGVKIELVVDPQTAPLEYPFSIKSYGQNYSYEIVNGAIIATGEDGNKITLHAPFAIDAAGEIGQVSYEMTGIVNNMQTFKKVVNEAWMLSRVGEVRIDPTVIIEDGVDGQTVEETHMRAAIPDLNSGGLIYVYVRENIYRGLFKNSFPDLGPITVLNSHWKLYNSGLYSVSITTYKVLRDWLEMEATWNSYQTGQLWTGAGATGEGDASSPLETQPILQGWDELNVDAAVTQDLYDSPATNFGILLSGSGLEASFNSSENGANNPQFYMEYTEAAAGLHRRGLNRGLNRGLGRGF